MPRTGGAPMRAGASVTPTAPAPTPNACDQCAIRGKRVTDHTDDTDKNKPTRGTWHALPPRCAPLSGRWNAHANWAELFPARLRIPPTTQVPAFGRRWQGSVVKVLSMLALTAARQAIPVARQLVFCPCLSVKSVTRTCSPEPGPRSFPRRGGGGCSSAAAHDSNSAASSRPRARAMAAAVVPSFRCTVGSAPWARNRRTISAATRSSSGKKKSGVPPS